MVAEPHLADRSPRSQSRRHSVGWNHLRFPAGAQLMRLAEPAQPSLLSVVAVVEQLLGESWMR